MDSNNKDLSRVFTKKTRGFDEGSAHRTIFKTPGRCVSLQRLNRTGPINPPSGSMNFRNPVSQAQAQGLMGPASKIIAFDQQTGKTRTSRPQFGKTVCMDNNRNPNLGLDSWDNSKGLFAMKTMRAKKQNVGYISEGRLPTTEADCNFNEDSMDDLRKLSNREMERSEGKYYCYFFDWI
jgi:hypothetical protein